MRACAVRWMGIRDVVFEEDWSVADPGPGELVIANHYSLVSPGTERGWLSSDISHAAVGISLPMVPGYSAVGVVAAVGADITHWAVGDRVAYTGGYSAHASHILAASNEVIGVPDGIALRDAVLYELGRTAILAVRLSDPKRGEGLAVVGQGPIGLLATQFAKVAGAQPVTILELDSVRRAHGLSVGADAALDPASDDLSSFSAPSVVDLSGAREGINQAFRVAAPRGVVALSTATMASYELEYGTVFIKGLTLRSAFVGAHPESNAADIASFLSLLASGEVTVRGLTDQVFDPRDAKAVYDHILDGDRDYVAPIFDWTSFHS